MNKIRWLLFCGFGIFLSFRSTSQGKVSSHESMIWIEAIEKVHFNDRLSATLLWHHRIFFDRENTFQDIYWLSLNRKIKSNLTLTGGMMYFTYHRFAYDNHLSVPEWRPFQSIVYSLKVKNTKTYLRLMLEERYTRKVDQGDLEDDYRFNMRLRNRICAFIPLTDRLKLELMEEILLRDMQQLKGTFDQSRARVRLHFSPGIGKFSFNVGYLHWLLNTSSSMQHRHSVMIGFKHQLDLG